MEIKRLSTNIWALEKWWIHRIWRVWAITDSINLRHPGILYEHFWKQNRPCCSKQALMLHQGSLLLEVLFLSSLKKTNTIIGYKIVIVLIADLLFIYFLMVSRVSLAVLIGSRVPLIVSFLVGPGGLQHPHNLTHVDFYRPASLSPAIWSQLLNALY